MNWVLLCFALLDCTPHSMFEILIFLFLKQVIVLVSKLDFVICTTLCDIYMIPLLFQLCKGKGGLIAIWHMISNAIFPNLIIGFGVCVLINQLPLCFILLILRTSCCCFLRLPVKSYIFVCV